MAERRKHKTTKEQSSSVVEDKGTNVDVLCENYKPPLKILTRVDLILQRLCTKIRSHMLQRKSSSRNVQQITISLEEERKRSHFRENKFDTSAINTIGKIHLNREHVNALYLSVWVIALGNVIIIRCHSTCTYHFVIFKTYFHNPNWINRNKPFGIRSSLRFIDCNTFRRETSVGL